VSRDFEIIQLEIEEAALQRLDNRLRNQLMGCMHAHNELTVLNRIFMFVLNDTGAGELHDTANSVQMWCMLQILAGKLFETWLMLIARFVAARPEDSALAGLGPEHRKSLEWLKDYFGSDEKSLKPCAIRIIRDKTAFHYDKLNLDEAVNHLARHENTVYLAQHPANSLYYLSSAVVFLGIFALIADKAGDTSSLTHDDRTKEGARIATEDAKNANFHMHQLLYGLIDQLLERTVGKPLTSLSQTRIPIRGAPDPEKVGLPAFVDMGR